MLPSMENQTNDDDQINMHEAMRRAFSLLSGKWILEIMWRCETRAFPISSQALIVKT